MSLLDDITLGRHLPGDSPAHRLDARLKLAGIPVLIVAVFAAGGPLQLAGLLPPALLLVGMSHIEGRLWWRGIWMLRWLFLFTLLLHIFFSPGRTLLGVAWLSLDGLLRGLLVCGQLTLAILFSSFLTLTTAPRELAAALGSLLSPFARFGLPVKRLTLLLLLVLHFIPVLREEAADLYAGSRSSCDRPTEDSLVGRARSLRRLMAPLVLRLVDRADAIGREVVAGMSPVDDVVDLPPYGETGRVNFLLPAGLLCWLSLLFVVWR